MRRKLTTAICAAAAIGSIAGVGPAAQAGSRCSAETARPDSVSTRALERSVLCLLNEKRQARGMRALRSDKNQRRAASRHNRLMIKKNCFAHQCRGEEELVRRLTKSGYLPHPGSWGVGENIAWGTGSLGAPKKIVKAWMQSPSHRHNILNPEFRHIGIGVHEGVPVGGVRGGATYTTDFGYKR